MDLLEKNRELRETLNGSICYKQNAWDRKESGNWSKLWIAFDNVEDTQQAINEFESKNLGRLAIYGVLQALVVQQDALGHLEEAIEIKRYSLNDYPELKNIRDIRNETIGHPTDTKKDRDRSSFENGTISYSSIIPGNNFGILEYAIWSKGGFDKKQVYIKNIIKIQENLLIKEIDRAISKVNADEIIHMKKFKDNSLVKKLSQSSYFIQKLWPYEKERLHSQICFNSLKDLYDVFKNEIKARYNLENINEFGVQIPGIVVEIQKIDKLLPKLEKMILMEKGVDQLDLEVYVESLANAFLGLERMAKEIDEQFNVQ